MRPSALKWNVGPERRKERATFCGRFGKRTPFLRGRVQLLGYEKRRLETNHWTRITQATACSRADILGSGRQSCEPELNFTGRTPEHKKTSTPASS